ncbi:ASCH domain-containing protein [Paraburkholderia sp. Ac-20342]|uniref:ASCH domain-containing protein n=1 Tax=Paraburkholderia sp. Ac-20342 TaxID=2703889 RepID=UPI001F1200BE|nr:ASCH domain-containing protein [Paraburkholderia sp. Ac-20342]MBN3848688.1 ASCH domain-containing protein [Paraburkholderia sp. Ac-20342]
MTLPLLVLPLKSCYFDDIAADIKPEEFRLDTEYWRKRLIGKEFSGILLTKGYPKADDQSRRMLRPWRGYVMRTIQHPHFGPDPVRVFAIDVRK